MIQEAVAIKLNEDYCSKCGLCCAVCPFEAISLDANTGKVEIDAEKCQFCGMCASTCPSLAIELAYYDEKALINHVREQREALGTGTLVAMCRGSSPPSGEILDVLKEQNVKEFIPVRVPCVGRLSPGSFYLKALSVGINKIVAIQCDRSSCRYKRGSEINIRRLQVLRVVLEQLGYKGEVLTILENPLKAVYATEKCVGCDKCEFICPYGAIEAQPFATPQVDLEACKGCGACAIVCPHIAIQLQGFEYEPSSQAIQEYGVEARKLKASGTSPIVLVFCCQWAEFSTLDHIENGFIRPNVMIAPIPCFNALDPVHVLDALVSGFDGVLAVVCRDEDCKLDEGRGMAEDNLLALERTLERLNLRERFEILKTSPRYVGSFDTELDSFVLKISSLSGSNQLRMRIDE